MEQPLAPARPKSLIDSLKQNWTELSTELWSKKEYIAKAAGLTLVLLALQTAFQYFLLGAGDWAIALLRGAALSGATLIGVALCLGPLAALRPQLNFVEYRRTVGVSGFLLTYIHVLLVLSKYFNFDAISIYSELNPFKNPLIFGSLASVIFLLLFLTSTDWAVSKLGFRNWKSLHRLVYFGFVFSVLHFTQTNPALLYNPAGYLLIAVSLAAMIFQLAGYVRKVSAGKAGAGTYVGAAITLIALALFAIAFFFKGVVGA